jgi:predicted DNA-binding protein
MKEKEEIKAQQIRFPVEMYRKLQKSAKESRRSFNAEVLLSLECFFLAHEALSNAAKATKEKK